MISRRNYFTITIVMFIIFFLFQFSNVALESWNHYEENSYVIDTSEVPDRSDSYGGENAEDFMGDARESVVFIGEEEGAVGETVSLWSTYTKRNIEIYRSLEEYEASRGEDGDILPAMIALDAADLDWSSEKGCELLEGYVQSGVHLIFCSLPEVSVVKGNQELQALLGIEMTRAEEMTVAEIYLHEGFLLGGEAFYSSEGPEEGMAFSFPWYVVSGESEIYLNGIPEKKSLGTELTGDEGVPAVIWRKDAETASVFVVNGSYMEDTAGLGILSAMSAKMSPYEIYPVVNAQNMIYANYPGLADENKEFLMGRYSQSLEGLFQNVIWPDLVALRRENGLLVSCMLAPQFDYKDNNEPNPDQFQRYMKLLNEQSAETGLSSTRFSDTPLEEKIAEDQKFMQEALPAYQFTSFYADDLTDEEIWDVLQEDLLGSVRTVVEDCNDNKEVIGYLSEYVTRQSAVIDGFEADLRHDFKMRCLETALGYTSVLIDMKDVVYPEQDETDWVFASSTLRQNLQDYGIGKQGFDMTAVSECDVRIRNFLALDYKESREFNSIYLERNDIEGPVWFVLRTDHERVESVEGGSWLRLEEDAYLIEVEQEKAVITMTQAG